MVLQTTASPTFELTITSQKMAQLLTEIKFLLEHSVEVCKVSVKQYFSLLMNLNQQAAAKHLKDFYVDQKNVSKLDKTNTRKAFFEICLQIFREYQVSYIDSSEPLLWKVIDHILRKISLTAFCSECYSWHIIELPLLQKKLPKNTSKTYYCQNCTQTVEIFQKFELFPSFLDYFVELSRNTRKIRKYRSKLVKSFPYPFKQLSKRHQNLLVLFLNLIQDLYNYAIHTSDISGAYALWIISKKMEFPTNILNPSLSSFIADQLTTKIEVSDFSDYAKSLDYLQKISPLKENLLEKYYLVGGIEKNIIRALSKANIDSFKHSYNFGVNHQLIRPQEFVTLPHFEAACTRGLTYTLENEDLEGFKYFYNFILSMGIRIDLHQIPHRLKLIVDLIAKSIKLRRLDNIFTILHFGNRYDLFYHVLTTQDTRKVAKITQDFVLIQALSDKFTFSSHVNLNHFIFFTFFILPPALCKSFEKSFHFLPFREDIIDFIKEFLDNYCLYGLTLKKLGTRNQFIHKISPLLNHREQYPDEVDFEYANRHFLLSLNNIVQLKNQYRQKSIGFDFPLVGMVIKGGLGPEGYGFAYFTPRGELVEICSDLKKNKAYIVQFKQFLKHEFIKELNIHISGLGLNQWQQSKLSEMLDNRLSSTETISIHLEAQVASDIQSFLEDEFDFNRLTKSEQESLNVAIKQKIHAILMPVTLVDQYRCRLELLHNGKLRSAEIAKITALNEISHYDILSERFFYQSLLFALKIYLKKPEYFYESKESPETDEIR